MFQNNKLLIVDTVPAKTTESFLVQAFFGKKCSYLENVFSSILNLSMYKRTRFLIWAWVCF